jgi:hypothetical protein
MAEQVTPLTGSPLSQESRQVIARNTSVSGQTIQGSNLLGRVTPSETEIKNLETLQQNQSSLIEVQSGIFGIKQDINQLNTGLISIATLLQQDATNEERILRSQQESERRLAEEQVRIGKESELEQKIQAAIIAPVERLSPKVQNLFGNILQSLGYLFGGWLTNQVIEYIETEGEGNNERLTEIKNNIIKNIAIAGGAIVAIKFGITALRKSLFGVTLQIAKLLGRTVAAPFNGIKNILSATAKPSGGSVKPSGGSAKPSGGGFGSTIKNMASGAGNFIKGLASPLLVGSAMTGLDIASGEDPSRAVAGATTGMIGSAGAFAVGSLLPIPGSGVVSSAVAYGPSADFGKGIYDKFFGKPQSQPQVESKPVQATNIKQPQVESKPVQATNIKQPQVESKPVEATNTKQPQVESKPVQPLILSPNSEPITTQKTEALKSSPQQEMVSEPNINFPDYSNIFNLSVDNTFDSTNITPEKSSEGVIKPNEAILPKSKELSFDASSIFKSGNTDNFLDNYNNLKAEENIFETTTPIQPAQIQTVPTASPNVGELPEPKPNIIYASSGSSQQQGTQMNQTPSNGPLTDVPMIRSSNPDNFHTLYSYSCYNVVI